jgi:hypothetical protein
MMKKYVMPILIGIVVILIGLILYFLLSDKKDYESLESVNENYYIEDRTETCAQALEELYRDDVNIYYLSCIKSETIFIINKQTKKEYTLKEAINSGLVTIDELKKTTVAVLEESIIKTKEVVTILGNNINFRTGHSVDSSKIKDYKLMNGEQYDVLDTYVGDEYTWYQIEYEDEIGWFANNGEWAEVEEVEIDE